MIYAYLRVSTDKQSLENQRYEILKYANTKKLVVDQWVEETESGVKKVHERKLGLLIRQMKANDVLLVAELTRIGRSLLDVMSTLNELMLKESHLLSVKENFELGENISSKVLAFAFGLSAEIERQLISQRTKEALGRRKANGHALGRPCGYKMKTTKLSDKKEEIKKLYEHRVSIRAIARIYGVHPETVKRCL